MNAIDDYARRVVAGRLPAGKYHRLACQRHLDDRTREGADAFPYAFHVELAERFFRFAEQLRHYKGEWAGQYVRLQPHQCFRLGSIFAWTHRDTGLRRFRTAYNEIPRKNGKSLEAALVGLYVTFFDGEPGAEGYCVATKRDQAKIVFGDCKKLVSSSGLRARITVLTANLHRDDTASKLEPLGADYDSTDGLNPNLIINDEFHAQKNREMLDVMETATGARRQPLNFQITTAGNDPVSPCGDQHEYACNILDRVIHDETFFAFIAHIDQGDDWRTEASWRKANPNFGVSVKVEDMQALAAKAINMPNAAPAFMQKRLNVWVNTASPCLSIEGWRKGQSDGWTEAEMEHEPCYVGVDLASRLDLCALAFLFPPRPGRPRWRLIERIWTPGETLDDRAHRDRAPYRLWVNQGWLLTTAGASIDHAVVRTALLHARDDLHFDVLQVGFDPWHAEAPIRDLVKLDGFSEEQVVKVPQTFQGMSAACLRFQAEIQEGDVDGRNSPVVAWAVANTVEQRDGNDNLLFRKRKSLGRIDPVIAATIARSLAIRHEDDGPSVYEGRGVVVL